MATPWKFTRNRLADKRTRASNEQSIPGGDIGGETGGSYLSSFWKHHSNGGYLTHNALMTVTLSTIEEHVFPNIFFPFLGVTGVWAEWRSNFYYSLKAKERKKDRLFSSSYGLCFNEFHNFLLFIGLCGSLCFPLPWMIVSRVREDNRLPTITRNPFVFICYGMASSSKSFRGYINQHQRRPIYS